jgi:putative oligomerization/nucleic acid binding protein
MLPPNDDLRRAVREIGQEVGKVIEQAGRMCRLAAQELGGFAAPGRPPAPPPASPPPPPRAAPAGQSPVELIRQLGELHQAGFLTDEEFQAKKAKLLETI